MCCYFNIPKMQKSDKDITVYKLVYKSKNGQLYAPFRRTRYNLSDSLYSKLGRPHKVDIYTDANPDKPFRCFEVSQGLHSFKSKGEAIKWMYENFMLSSEHQIIKATIPKGAMYYEGFWHYDGKKLKTKTIVSDKLILHPEKVVMDRTIKHFEVKTRLWTFDSSNI